MLKPGPQINFIVPEGLIVATKAQSPAPVDAAGAVIQVKLQAVRISNTY